jgi:hypothetical protein
METSNGPFLTLRILVGHTKIDIIYVTYSISRTVQLTNIRMSHFWPPYNANDTFTNRAL